jgi:hypothetical protein
MLRTQNGVETNASRSRRLRRLRPRSDGIRDLDWASLGDVVDLTYRGGSMKFINSPRLLAALATAAIGAAGATAPAALASHGSDDPAPMHHVGDDPAGHDRGDHDRGDRGDRGDRNRDSAARAHRSGDHDRGDRGDRGDDRGGHGGGADDGPGHH